LASASVNKISARPLSAIAASRVFDFEWPDGSSTHMEELAYQRCEGERIAEEKFFYDPAQLKPIAS
jgi:hypothetical protein